MQIQHLQAQVELLEADSAGRQADSRPGSPRESEVDSLVNHVETLQADNNRLQQQVLFVLFAYRSCIASQMLSTHAEPDWLLVMSTLLLKCTSHDLHVKPDA